MRFAVEALPQAFAAILLVALIVVILRVGGQRPQNRALAAFFAVSTAFDISVVTAITTENEGVRHVANLVGTTSGLIDSIFLLRFAVLYIRDGAPRAWYASSPLFWTVAGGLAAWGLFSRPAPDVFQSGDSVSVVDMLLDVIWLGVAFVLARTALRDGSGAWRSRLILASALALLFASFDVPQIPLIARTWSTPQAPLDAARHAISEFRAFAALALIGYLLVAGSRLPERGRAATLAALAIIAGGLIGLGAEWLVLARRSIVLSDAIFFVPFLVTPLLVAYALLRHQLLDIDLKIKVGLSRGALAAIFLAVFFIVTQIAQNYFQGYGVVAGGVAAGLLLFAISPLQRVAERFADRAMPGVGPRADASSKERAYKNALRFALSDGAVSRDEEMQLAHLADELGLSTQTATRLRHEVDAESASRPRAP